MSLRATVWEEKILNDLLRSGDVVYVVCKNTSASLHLFLLARDLDVDADLVSSMEDWRARVFCDCVAQGPRRTIPTGAARVYTHTADVAWRWLTKPPSTILKEAPCRSSRT